MQTVYSLWKNIYSTKTVPLEKNVKFILPNESEIPQTSTTNVLIPQIDAKLIEETKNPVLQESLPENIFSSYTIEISYNNEDYTYDICGVSIEAHFLTKMSELCDKHKIICFKSNKYCDHIMRILETKFDINGSYLTPKIIKSQLMADGTYIIEYINKVIEIINYGTDSAKNGQINQPNMHQCRQGTRFFPNGIKECGFFNYDGELINGYVLFENKYTFYRPKLLFSFGHAIKFNFAEISLDNKLKLFPVVEVAFGKYKECDSPISDILIELATNYFYGSVIDTVIRHSGIYINSEDFIAPMIAHTVEKSAPILSFVNASDVKIILRKMSYYDIEINTELIKLLFNKWVAKGYISLIKKILEFYPSFTDLDGSYFSKCIMNNEPSEASIFLNMYNPNWSVESNWIRKIYIHDTTWDNYQFLNLDIELQKKIYMIANTYNNFDLIEKLNECSGIYVSDQDLIYCNGPNGVLAYNMDAIRIKETLTKFFKQLRSDAKIFTKAEFDEKIFGGIEKGNDFGRLLGKEYVDRTIQKLNLKYIKTPLKVVVLQGLSTHLKIMVTPSAKINIQNYIKLYAKRISR